MRSADAVTSKLQWGRGLKTPEIRGYPVAGCAAPRFNGAGVLRPRKWPPFGSRLRQPEPLQWGRGLKTPEISFAQATFAWADKLQWGRGLKTPEMGKPLMCYTATPGFNGAGVLRPRKSTVGGGQAEARHCFNGAGVLRPRKSACGIEYAPHPYRLQWGRGLKTPEIRSITR